MCVIIDVRRPSPRERSSDRVVPGLLRQLSANDPLTDGVWVLRSRPLRGAEPSAAYADWVFLATFTIVAGVLTKVLFRREV